MSGPADVSPPQETPDAAAREAVDRLDRLTVWPYPWWVLLTVGLGFFFAFFDIGNIGLSLPAIAKSLGVGDAAVAWAVSSGLVGYILGALGNGMVSDHLGRLRALTIAYTLVAVGSIASAFSFDPGWLIGWRLITGAGIGAAIATVATYISELSPATVRGRYTGWATLSAFSGVAVTPFVAAALVPNFSWGWQVNLGIPVLAAFSLPALLSRLPESPRWLLSHGRYDDAVRVVRAAEDRVRERGDLADFTLAPSERPPAAEPAAAPIEHVGYRAVLGRRLRGRALLLTVMWFFFYIQNYAFAGLGTTLLVEHGYSLSQGILFSLPTSVANIAGGALAPFIADRFERRKSIVAAALLMVVVEVGIGVIDTTAAIIVGFFLAAFGTALWDAMNYTLTAEQFPTRARNAGVAVSDGIGHLGGAVAPPLVLAIFATFGFAAAFITMAATVLIAALFVPFTKKMVGRSLE